ncbi:MAG: alpha/beta hydrolase, partial [Kangiellaceae bacterium]|nr:alpha/beta hydrolase [Kangiellaceae bacterium]
VDCSVEEHHPHNKNTIILLHGWLDNLASFQRLSEQLSDFRLILLDFPGHGQSAHLPPGQVYYFIDLVNVIDDLVEHFELDKFFIVAHSMGAAVSTLYAALNRNLAGLVLIDGHGPLSSKPEEVVELLQKALASRRQRTGKRMFNSLDDMVKARALHSKVAEGLIKPIVERGSIKQDNQFRWSSDARLKDPSHVRLSEQQVQYCLSAIQCNVVLILAKGGFLYNHPITQQRIGKFKSCELFEWNGSHHIHLERPIETAEVIKNFIQRQLAD